MLRDNTKDSSWFDEQCEWLAGLHSAGEKAECKSNPQRPQSYARCLQRIFEHLLEHLICRYSRGDDLGELRTYYGEVLDALEEADGPYRDVYTTSHGKFGPLSFFQPSDAYRAFVLLAFSYSLNVGHDQLQRLFRVLQPEGVEPLLDRVIAVYQPEREIGDLKDWKVNTRFYRGLYDVLDAPKDKQTSLLQKYLKRWPKLMIGKELGIADPENDSYVGAWSFETAAVVKAFGLDDSKILDDPHYPADLVHWQEG